MSNTDALICEVEALWQAESTNAKKGDISANWGCVGALFRPQGTLGDWRQEWRDYFRGKQPSVVSPVSKDGLLCIPWPVKVSNGNEVDVDVILATATKAECKIPTPEQVADAWIDKNNGYESYFFENVRCCIRTPDDGSIWRRIKERKPSWMKKDKYSKAVAILEEEALASLALARKAR